jgi:hypothetical protein
VVLNQKNILESSSINKGIMEESPPPTPSQLPPVPASPTFSYASTANPLSTFNLPLPPPPRRPHAVLTKNDLELSQSAYGDLLATAKQYRLALAELSTAASSFGSALEACARLKEARSEALHPAGNSIANSFTTKGSCTADSLLAASGIHHLIANHQQILSETVYRSFEVPLLHELDGWRRRMEEEEVTYQQEVRERGKEIRRMEKEGLRLHKQRKRDVSKFRSHLVDLTTKLDSLTSLHGGHSRTLLRDSQETSLRILDASSSLVRAEVDIFEGLARKGWTGGGLDELLERGVDLFANEPETGQNDSSKLFSILPQKSILADTTAENASGAHPGHARHDSLVVEGERYQSLAGAVSNNDQGDDVRSIFSEGNFNRSRGVRPFSPSPPVTRNIESQDSIKTTDESSAKTVTKTALADGEGSATELPTPSEEKGRGRVRRWSVTDDGVVSE